MVGGDIAVAVGLGLDEALVGTWVLVRMTFDCCILPGSTGI